MEAAASDQAATDREIVVSRVIAGPRRVVFEAFSEVGHLARWWGPDGFTTTTHSFQFHPSGIWDFTMHGPDGTNYPNRIEWLEIVPPERIVLLHGARQDDPEAFTSTVTLVERDTTTVVTLRSVFATKALRDKVIEEYGAIEGAEQTLGRLAGYIDAAIEGGDMR
jgi:uncharacterized protein YndB with AHSA1/START domain